jgi:hypothetical protein
VVEVGERHELPSDVVEEKLAAVGTATVTGV